jgi:transcriptional regulator GlxA family with amidase domain
VIEEIVRVRLQKAKELLATMKITMLAVSAATGFRHRGKLTRAF